MIFSKPQIMGILNVTPDSFSDGGDFFKIQNSGHNRRAELKIQQLIENGADIIDIGGESTGPGSKDISLEEEMRRIKPVVDYIAKNNIAEKVLLSVDTYKAPIAEYALQNGFQIVNDVTALRGDPDMIDILIKYKPYIILMYAKDNTPRTTAESVEYDDVIAGIKTFFISRISQLVEAGFPGEKIIIDPGMGMFVSANPKYSFEIIERLSELKTLGYPILIGVSRKSFLGGKLKERDRPSVEWSIKAIQNGADVVRIHNVELIGKAF